MNNYISSQDFGLSTKYSINVGNSYDSYGSFSLGGSYFLNSNMFEVGATVGIIYSEPNINFDFTIPEYYEVDVIDISKTSFGVFAYYYPFIFKTTYSPFISIKWEILNKWKNFLQFSQSSSSYDAPQPGLFSFITKDDMIFSISTGLKILSTKGLNFILELEYQHRKFTLEYGEYDYDSNDRFEMIKNTLII